MGVPLVALLALSTASGEAANASAPHILFFMADDTGWSNVGWHNAQMETPHADALVKEGLELDRHYAYLYCSPSRSSLMTGRLPFHVQQVNRQNCDAGQGVADQGFTFIAAKLKSAGYQTVHVGKWHLGMASHGHIPLGRGFDQSLVYFEGAEDHVTQRSCIDPECIVPITDHSRSKFGNGTSPYDLWRNDAPAADVAGSRHNGYQFNDFATAAVLAYNASGGPLFMYLAPASAHTPLEPPDEFLERYPPDWYLDRRQYAGLCSLWDEILGNVTAALRSRQMWSNTLLVFSADNGGPVYWSVDPFFPHGAGANNWPLRGGKTSNWEGGTRVAAFVSGGFLPEGMRGKKLSEYIHMADWYSTFCHLAGVDPADAAAAAAGLPPIDSIDMWPLLSGAAASSPRTEIPLAVDANLGQIRGAVSALIVGEWKILQGLQRQSFWQGPEFPNASGYGKFTDPALNKHCGDGCLYNILSDPTEQVDQAAAQPTVLAAMQKRLDELRPSHYQPPSSEQTQACQAQVKANGNIYGPWLP